MTRNALRPCKSRCGRGDSPRRKSQRVLALKYLYETGVLFGHPFMVLFPERFREVNERVFQKMLSGDGPRAMPATNLLGRRKDGAWQRIETYVRERVPVEFSHGLCPSCVGTLYGSPGDLEGG